MFHVVWSGENQPGATRDSLVFILMYYCCVCVSLGWQPRGLWPRSLWFALVGGGRCALAIFRLVSHTATPFSLRFPLFVFWALDLLLRFCVPPPFLLFRILEICIWCGRTNGVILFVSCYWGRGELGCREYGFAPSFTAQSLQTRVEYINF